MTKTGLNPEFLAKLDEGQQKIILSGYGKFLWYHFLKIKGEHGFVVGPTGSGKTQKGYNLVNWLKHLETIIWISTSKDNEIVPLLFMGKPVQIITPAYTEVEIRANNERIPHHPPVVTVQTPDDVWFAIRKNHINILEFRNAFWDKSELMAWMSQMFLILSEWTRRGIMPKIAPASIFVDESQWVMAGSRITTEGTRVKSTEIISENAMEIRTYGFRLVLFSQDFTNIPPAIRENMPCVFLCNNAEIDTPRKLRRHCNPTVPGWIPTSRYKRSQCKFVNRMGESMPTGRPLDWPLYPKSETDRALASRMKVHYAGYHDIKPATAEADIECEPNLGRYAALAIPPDKLPVPETSRFDAPQVIDDD